MTMERKTPWWRSVGREPWKALVAAQVGWMLDAMDVMLYAFALTEIQREFALSSGAAGGLASVTLLAGAFGGVGFGILADRFGRAKMLMVSILLYSVFTGLTATAHSVAELLVWRSLVGIGLGGEWTAGSVLVAESWPAEHRGKAIGFMQSGWAVGYLLAAGLAALVIPRFGWRPLFAIGIVPALFVWWVRRNVPEPELWLKRAAKIRSVGVAAGAAAIFRRPLAARTWIATSLAACLLFAYWGLFTWVPTYLSSPVEHGGAGLGIVKSAGWILPMQIGAFFGYIAFGLLADRFGRRRVFTFFVLAAAVIAPVYGLAARNETALLCLGPALGFFGHGYFSVFGSLLAELFPSSVRATAQGFCYNAGRATSALAPFAIGVLADRYGLGSALALTSLFYLAAAALMILLPRVEKESLA